MGLAMRPKRRVRAAHGARTRGQNLLVIYKEFNADFTDFEHTFLYLLFYHFTTGFNLEKL
jgi:hypothetical protein